MKAKKHLLILSGIVVSMMATTSLTSCSEDNDLAVGKDGLLSLEGYPTIFAVSNSNNAQEMSFLGNDNVSAPKKISVEHTYFNWYWTPGDNIYVMNGSGGYYRSAQSNIPSGVYTNHNAAFGFTQSLSAPSYEVRYTGNGGDNPGASSDSGSPTTVTISAEQTQDVEGKSYHIGKYGDCGVVTTNGRTETEDKITYSFELEHKAAYILFSPYVQIEGPGAGETTPPDYIENRNSNTIYYGSQIPIKKIKVTKLDDEGYLCGTYNFTSSGLDTNPANVTNGGKTITLICPEIEGKQSSVGDMADEGKTLFMVVQPGQHRLQIEYEFDYPELVFNDTQPTSYTISWEPKTFTFTMGAAHDFTENGFTKVQHHMDIPSYRESFTYYAWGASSNYFASYHDLYVNSDGAETQSQAHYFPFDDPCTSRENELVTAGQTFANCQSMLGKRRLDDTYEKLHANDYLKNCAYASMNRQLKHYYSDMREFFNTKIALHNPRGTITSSQSDAKVKNDYLRKFYGSFGGYDYPAFHLPVYLPLWPITNNMGQVKFYTKSTPDPLNYPDPDDVPRYEFNVPQNEPNFITNTNKSTEKNRLAGTLSNFNMEIHEDVYATNTYEISREDEIKSGETIIPIVHVNRGSGEDFTELYRSITRMPNANEMAWYLTYGDIHYDNTTYWMAREKTIDGMYPLVRGGIWIKKKEHISGFSNSAAPGGQDLRANKPANNNGYRHYKTTYSGSLPSGATKDVKIGVPANKDDYFFLPLLGYYHTDATSSSQATESVKFSYYGKRGYYWSRTPVPGDNYSSYYLIITPDYVALDWTLEENRKHGMVGNERPDWQRYQKTSGTSSPTYIQDNMQNDWWFQ